MEMIVWLIIDVDHSSYSWFPIAAPAQSVGALFRLSQTTHALNVEEDKTPQGGPDTKHIVWLCTPEPSNIGERIWVVSSFGFYEWLIRGWLDVVD